MAGWEGEQAGVPSSSRVPLPLWPSLRMRPPLPSLANPHLHPSLPSLANPRLHPSHPPWATLTCVPHPVPGRPSPVSTCVFHSGQPSHAPHTSPLGTPHLHPSLPLWATLACIPHSLPGQPSALPCACPQAGGCGRHGGPASGSGAGAWLRAPGCVCGTPHAPRVLQQLAAWGKRRRQPGAALQAPLVLLWSA